MAFIQNQVNGLIKTFESSLYTKIKYRVFKQALQNNPGSQRVYRIDAVFRFVSFYILRASIVED